MGGLYNLLFGWNPACVLLAPMLTEENPQTFFPRFRDCYVSDSGDTIEIYTRVGGGNRDAYEDEIESLRNMPTYIRDYDDDFDDVRRFKKKWLVKSTPKNRVEFYQNRFEEYAREIMDKFKDELEEV